MLILGVGRVGDSCRLEPIESCCDSWPMGLSLDRLILRGTGRPSMRLSMSRMSISILLRFPCLSDDLDGGLERLHPVDLDMIEII